MKEPKLRDSTPTLVPFFPVKAIHIYWKVYRNNRTWSFKNRKDTVKPEPIAYLATQTGSTKATKYGCITHRMQGHTENTLQCRRLPQVSSSAHPTPVGCWLTAPQHISQRRSVTSIIFKGTWKQPLSIKEAGKEATLRFHIKLKITYITLTANYNYVLLQIQFMLTILSVMLQHRHVQQQPFHKHRCAWLCVYNTRCSGSSDVTELLTQHRASKLKSFAICLGKKNPANKSELTSTELEYSIHLSSQLSPRLLSQELTGNINVLIETSSM